MKVIKYAKTAIVCTGLLLASAVPSFAATTVYNTGDHVHVTSTKTDVHIVEVSSSNSAFVATSVYSLASSGGNKSNGNIGGGFINTSAAGISTLIHNCLNFNATFIGSSPAVLPSPCE